MKTVTKKVRDLTAGEIVNECRRHISCKNCPLRRAAYSDFCDPANLTEDELDTEITLEVKE